MQILKLIRVHQWVKNLFVFLPVFFAGKMLDWQLNLQAFYGFLLFSVAAGAIYIINDYADIEKDKLHPTKKNRPLASGAISKNQAKVILLALVALGGFIAWFIYHNTPKGNNYQAQLIVLIYFVMNLAYSFHLKNVSIIDILIIAIGFLMRVLVGGYVTGLVVSEWAILLVFMLALILAIGKRRGELVNNELSGKTRKALDGYNMRFIDAALSLICGVTVMCYILFTLTPETQARFHKTIYFTVIIVMAGILRFLQLALVYNQSESPTKLVYKDRFLQIVILVWMLAFGILIYMNNFSFNNLF